MRAESLPTVTAARGTWRSAWPSTRSARSAPSRCTVVAEFSQRHAVPLHAHVSEQRAENTACVERYAASPVQVLRRARRARSPLDRRARHAPVRRGHRAARRLPVPTCACARRPSVTSPTASARPGRCSTRARRSHSAPTATRSSTCSRRPARSSWTSGWPPSGAATGRAAELLHAATVAGHASLGFPDAGMLVPGAWADLVSVRLDSVRTAGASPATRRGGGLRRDGRRRALGGVGRPPGGRRGPSRPRRRGRHARRGDRRGAGDAGDDGGRRR